MKKLFRGSFRIITAVIVMMTVLFVCSYSDIESHAQEYIGTIVDNPKYASYTLSYSANGGSGAPSSQSGYSSYTISSTVPVRFGYTFLGWSTSSSASSASYSPGNSISLSSSRTLYAVWQSASTMYANSSYTAYINFSEQERYYSFTPSSSGSYIFQSTGSLDSRIYVYNSSGSLIDSDDDEGADYNFLLQLSLTSGTKYYVKVRAYSSGTGSTSFSVKPISCNLSYNANGGSGAPSTQTGASSYTISSTIPSKMGYTFLGWSKSSSASSASYVPGNTISLTSATTLYAVWKSATTISTNSSYTASVSFVGQEVYYSFTPSSTISYTFESTASFDTVIYVYNSSGSQIDYNDDGGSNRNFRLTLTLTSGTKYYVKVRAYSSGTGSIPFTVRSASTYTLTYNANGGSGAPSSQSGASSYTISSTAPTRFCYTFLGWSTSSTATSASYTSGNTISLTANTTLYAVWRSNATALSANSSVTASITSSKKVVYYEFVPSTTAKYVIYSSSSIDAVVTLYDSTGTQIDADDDSGGSRNFLLRNTLTAGNRYFYAVRYYSESNTGSLPFTFGRAYTVTYYANGGSGAPSSQTKDYGKTLTLSSTVPTYSGKTFVGWGTSSSSTTASYQPSGSYTGNSDLTLYAVWGETTRPTVSISSTNNVSASQTVTLSLSDNVGVVSYYWGTSSSPSSSSYTSITSTASTTVTKTVSSSGTYYLFAKDASGNVSYSASATFYLTTFNANNGSVSPSSVITKSGYSFTLPSATRSGYTLQGWATSSTATSASYSSGVSYTPSSSRTLYAVWTLNSYTLTYNANGGTGAPSSVTGGSSYTISSTVPVRFGYAFLGWSKSSTATSASYTPGNTISLSSDTTLYAVWKQATAILADTIYTTSVVFAQQEHYYTFTPSSTGSYTFESTGSVDSKVYVYNSSGTELGNDDDSSVNGTNFKLDITLTSGTTYYVKVRAHSSNTGSFSFTVKRGAEYRLSYYSDSDNTYNIPGNQTGSATYTISSTIPNRFRYTFLGWSKTAGATTATYKPGDSITLTENTTLYAVWQGSIAMTLNQVYTATVSFSNQEVFYSFTPSQSGSYVFESTGSVDSRIHIFTVGETQLDSHNSSGNFSLRINLTGGTKYYVRVAKSSYGSASIPFSIRAEIYNLTYDANGGSGAPESQIASTSCTISSVQPTRPGYTFLGWAMERGASAGYYLAGNTVTLTEDTTLYAVWSANDYTVSYNANGGSGTMENTSHTYGVAKTLTTSTYTKTGYTFMGWATSSDSDVVAYTDGQSVMNLTDTDDDVVTLYAVWSANTYTVVYNANGGSGTMADSSFTYDVTAALTLNAFTMTDGSFLGWATSSDSDVVTYTDGQSVTNLATTNGATVTLYAVWHMHTYTTVVTSDADCENDGEKIHTCQECSYSYTEIIPASGHTWEDATCTRAKQCSTCGDTEGDALGHSWTDATCTASKVCARCRVISGTPLGHDYSSSVTTNPTCTQTGIRTYRCSRCPSSYTETVESLGHDWADATCTVPETCSRCNVTQGDALGHDYSSETTVDAGCTTDGTMLYECSRCSHSYNETIPATGHSWADATCTAPGTCSVCMVTRGNALGHNYDSEVTQSATCTEDGTMLYDCSRCYHYYTEAIPATGHRPGVATCTEPSTCSQCGVVTGNALGHDYVETVITEATCTEDGEKEYYCSRCADEYAEDIDATGHDWLDATCSLPKRCSVCALTQGNALGHIFESEVLVRATCTLSGEKLYTCVECGDSHSEIIPPAGHNEQHVEGTPATCTGTGLTDSSVCSVCGIVLVEQTVIPATGHDHVSVVTAPTCTGQGYTTHTCFCGDSYIDTYVDATGHSFSSWRETKTPTYRQNGEKVRDCSVCGEVQTQVIDKLAAQQEISDSATGVIVRFMFSSYNGSASLNVNVITEGELYNVLHSDKADYRKQIFDIATLVDEEDTQPNGLILIGIPVPEDYNAEGSVIYIISEDGSGYVKADTYYRNGYIWIETDHTGVFAIVDESAKIEPPEEPEYVLGDANGDGKVTAADARKVLRVSAKIETLEGTATLAADVNKDGKINASDARKILRVSAKVETF